MKDKYIRKSDGLNLLDLDYQDPAELAKQEREREQRELNKKLYELQCGAPVEDIDDLLWKYEEYNPKIEDNTLYINKPVRMKRFMTLKKDATKCGIDNIRIEVLNANY